MYNIASAKKIVRKRGYRSLFTAILVRKLGFGYLFVPFAAKKLAREKDSVRSVKDTIDFAFGFDYLGISMKPIQVRSEITKLLGLLQKKRPKSILEIGTANGGTLFLFAKSSDRNAKIVSLDYDYAKWRGTLYKSFVLPSQKLYLLTSDSHAAATLDRIKGILGGEQVDFLFIDGDHSYEGVKKDFEMYSKLVRKGGMIGFHDIAVHPSKEESEVNLFYDEIKKGYKSLEIIENRKQGWGGIGILYK
jgi:predicted O-methyltransferase YrrM